VNLLEKSDSQKYGLTTESVNQEPPEEPDIDLTTGAESLLGYFINYNGKNLNILDTITNKQAL